MNFELFYTCKYKVLTNNFTISTYTVKLLLMEFNAFQKLHTKLHTEEELSRPIT